MSSRKPAEVIPIFSSVVIFLSPSVRLLSNNNSNIKTKAIPVIIGATGTISKKFKKYVSNMPGNHEVKELQKQPYWALHKHF